MKSYLLDGKEAHGADYIAPLEILSDEDDIHIGIPDERGLIVSVCSDGFFGTEERPDGSTYLTTGLTKERVRALVHSFLSEAEDWREGLEWELTTHPSKRVARRALLLLLTTGVLAAFAWWLTRVVSR
jgi:hypothetical protein